MIYYMLLLVYRALPERLQKIVAWLLSPKTAVGVAVAAFDAEGEVLLFQHRYDQSGAWRLPGGHVRRGEPPDLAVHRELAEEGGALTELGDLVSVEVSKRWPSRMTLYYCGALRGLPQRKTAEVTGWRLCSLQELPRGMPLDQRLAIEAAAARLGHRITTL